MANPYRALLLLLLPLLGCEDKVDDDSGVATDGGAADGGATDGGSGDGGSGDGGTPATESEQGCYDLPEGETECTAPGDVPLEQVIPATCGAEVVSVDGAGTPSDSCGWIGGMAPETWCIYPITVIPPEDECDYGRPLVVEGAPRTAALVGRIGWTGPDAGRPDPDLRAEDRAATWARIALAEHASVASFHRFVLELLSLGAPAPLVQLAQDAARDEVVHAQLAFGLASDLAQTPLGPGPLPLDGLAFARDLAELAAATVRDGCIAETLSALQVALARDRATDPREQAVLDTLARDEQRHAALAWQVARWALETGGEPVRAAVTAALEGGPDVAGRSGLLPPEVARQCIERGWAEVIRPAAAALLHGTVGEAAEA